MKIVVIGGSGLIGSKLVSRLREPGHTVVAAAPGTEVNTLTGAGVSEALLHAAVVIDVSNTPSYEAHAETDFFQRSTANLLPAAIRAGVQHYIALSVVGADRLPRSGYMRSKVEQENLIRSSGLPYTILRATHFFELAGRMVQAGAIGGEVHIPQTPVQPVAADEVAAALADIALGAPLNKTLEIAGPVCMPLYELVRYYLNETEDPRQLIEDEHALYFGTTLPERSLTTDNPSILGTMKYETWFHNQLTAQ